MHKFTSKYGIPAIAAVVALLILGAMAAQACLRPTVDTRAVQWSSIIVHAKFLSAGQSIGFGDGPSSQPSTGDKTVGSPFSYRLYQFEVIDNLKGSAKAGDKIQVVDFSANSGDAKMTCAQQLSPERIGQSFTLLLVPESELTLAAGPAYKTDPRPASLHELHAFAMVHLDLTSDLGDDGLADLKQIISDVHSADTQFSEEQAKTQAETLAGAADDTEADQAQQALLEMGPKAVPAIRAALDKADDTGKTRLREAIDSLAVPAIKLSGDASDKAGQ